MTARITTTGTSIAAAAMLGALAVTGAPGSAEAGGTAILDHFNCYHVSGDFVEARVQLQDQFDRRLEIVEDVLVGHPLRFCNPVHKVAGRTVTEISDRDHHLTFYQFDPINGGTTVGAVKIANQFGEQALKVQSASILAVPTLKRESDHEPPKGLDHFKRYFASGRTPRQLAVVGLADQFESLQHKL